MKKISVLFAVLFFSLVLHAQDVHFSQFFSSPLTINPANTGLFNGKYRIGANYKRQWASIPVPYQTYSAWGDLSYLRTDKESFGKLGVGLAIVQDQAGDGQLASTKVNLAAAYHLPLDGDHYHYLSLGIQTSFIQKRIDFNQLYWGNQWDGTQFNTQTNNKEPYRRSSTSYFDACIGLDYLGVINQTHTLHGGFSVQHLLVPKETFYDNDNQLGIKPILNLGGRFKLNDRVELWTEAFYEQQKKAKEFLASALLGYNIAEDFNYTKSVLWIGVSLRSKDALVPVLGYEYQQIRFLLNYDITISSLKLANSARGGLELSIIYIGETKQPPYRQLRIVPCPVF
jgi:type IX secretion system PorP/SprF family membrane protein